MESHGNPILRSWVNARPVLTEVLVSGAPMSCQPHYFLIDQIIPRWVHQFQEIHGIINKTQTGKLMVSLAKIEFIECSTAYHMGILAWKFQSGELDENLCENMDETHFVINMDNGKTLGFRGDKEVKYADIVSSGIGIMMVVKVTGGVVGRISTPFLNFQNKVSSYPICGVPDIVPRVCYQTTAKGFMTSQLLLEYYKDSHISYPDPEGHTKVQWLDNALGHKILPECEAALQRIRTELWHFPNNSTHLTQPCDSFVISKIKDAWTHRWEEKKLEMLRVGHWPGDGTKGTSGSLRNLGKNFFLQLAAASVQEVS